MTLSPAFFWLLLAANPTLGIAPEIIRMLMTGDPVEMERNPLTMTSERQKRSASHNHSWSDVGEHNFCRNPDECGVIPQTQIRNGSIAMSKGVMQHTAVRKAIRWVSVGKDECHS